MKSVCIGLFKNTNNDLNKKYITHILNQCNSLITISPNEYTDDKLNKIISDGTPIRGEFRSKVYHSKEEINIYFFRIWFKLVFWRYKNNCKCNF